MKYIMNNKVFIKRTLLLLFFVCSIHTSFSQKGSRERINSIKIAYITEKINLTTKEAQGFWPIYNRHQKTMDEIRKEERNLIRRSHSKIDRSLDDISENEAKEFLSKHIIGQEQIYMARKRLILDLKEVISDKKILKLVKAQIEFNRNLINELRSRKNRN